MMTSTCSGPQGMSEPWLGAEEVARHLDVAKGTNDPWIEPRGLPAYRIGRFWKFKISEVDTWVQRGGAADIEEARKTKKGGGRA